MPESIDALSNNLTHLRHRRRPIQVLLHLEESLFSEIVRTSLERLDQVELFHTDDVDEAASLIGARAADLVVLDGDADDPVDTLTDIQRLRAAAPDVRVIVLLADDDPS